MSLVEVDQPQPGVATVTLNRPEKYNAFTEPLIHELGEAFATLSDDAAIRAVVLTGAGKAFCAGLDLDALGDGAAFDGSGLRPIQDFPHPVIGAVNGVAITGGLELALACDFRVASTAARFADTHSRVGVVPGWGLTARLPQAVGQAWARQMSFTGDFVDAAAALRIGLVNEVVDPDTLLDRCVSLAASIASTNGPTLTTVRSLYDLVRDGTGSMSLGREAELATSRGFLMADPEGFASRRDAVFGRGRSQAQG